VRCSTAASMRATESSGAKWTKRRRRHGNMIVIVTLISTTSSLLSPSPRASVGSAPSPPRPSFKTVSLHLVSASPSVSSPTPTLSVVTAFVRNGSTFTPQMLSGFDPNSLLISLVIGAFATTVLAVFEYIKRVWRQEEQAEESKRTQAGPEPPADTELEES